MSRKWENLSAERFLYPLLKQWGVCTRCRGKWADVGFLCRRCYTYIVKRREKEKETKERKNKYVSSPSVRKMSA